MWALSRWSQTTYSSMGGVDGQEHMIWEATEDIWQTAQLPHIAYRHSVTW